MDGEEGIESREGMGRKKKKDNSARPFKISQRPARVAKNNTAQHDLWISSNSRGDTNM